LDTGTPEAPKPKPDLAPVPPSPIELSPPQGVGEEYSRDLPIPSVEKDAGKAAASQDAYGALAKLNTGAKEREQRTQRVYVEEQSVEAASRSEQAPSAESSARARSAELVAQAMAAAPPRDRAASASSSGVADARERAKPEDARAEAETPVDATSSEPVAPPAPAPAQPEAKRELGAPGARRVAIQAQPEPPRAATPAASEWVRVVVDPLRGRLARSGELLLVRSAWIGARGVRQGVAFEVPALERTLAGAALGDGALPGARVQLAPAPRVSASPSDREGFSHRFAEPFDALAATLALPPFADAAGRTVYWLAALFCLAGAGGLFAAYRTTTVALHFAERRSNFAAAVSHELKTPLTAIRLYAEMLRDGLVSGDEKRREYYGSITAEAERLSRLINNVLEFSRLEKGARTLTLSAGDLGPAVREAVELLRPHAAEHGLALELAIEEGLPAVRFERDALLQILFNLIDNAIKYGRGKPASIEISCRRAAGGVALAVRDHGPGVPREELGRILEPFYRRGDELTRSAPGAGIGLALVRSLAQRMGAALVLRNAVPSGLEASLTLPAA
jgi:signal transduction histidine kinase